jgi:urease accessory protein
MLRFNQIIDGDQEIFSSLTLTFDQRARTRQKVELENGDAAGLFLPRGSVLQHGNKIQAESGEVVEIRAAKETVSTLYVKDPLIMARACYHLGNRHVPLQIAEGFVRYQHDHVLDDMVSGLGLSVVSEQAAFQPEAGAYGGHGHQHSHGSSHAHDH